MLNTKKQEHSNGIEIQSNSNQNTEQTLLTQEEKINVEIIKRMMSEKETTLPSLRNQEWKTVKVETEKNKLIINTYPNEQHHRIKQINLCRSKISVY